MTSSWANYDAAGNISAFVKAGYEWSAFYDAENKQRFYCGGTTARRAFMRSTACFSPGYEPGAIAVNPPSGEPGGGGLRFFEIARPQTAPGAGPLDELADTGFYRGGVLRHL